MDEQDRPLHRAAAQRCDLRRFLLLRPLQAGAQLLQFLCAVRFQQGGVSGKFSLCLHGRLSVRPRQGKDAGDIPHFLFLAGGVLSMLLVIKTTSASLITAVHTAPLPCRC